MIGKMNLKIGVLLKQTVDLGINAVDHIAQIFRIILEVDAVDINNQQFAGFVTVYPGFVTFVQLFQIVEADGIFIFSSTFLNLVDQSRYRSPEAVSYTHLRAHET